MKKVCAVFIFNHKFERNVAVLDRIYGDRFEHRRFIMPFASGGDDRVIPIYEASWHFSGHIAQAAARIIDPSFTHYVFISDDLVLNPALNQDNIISRLGLGKDDAYTKSLASIDALRFRWPWSAEAMWSMHKFGKAFDYLAELPSAAEARAKFERLGIPFPSLKPRGAREWRYLAGGAREASNWAWLLTLATMRRPATYPLLGGYADFFIVPGNAMSAFAHYSGTLAALNIFAEVAVPTALALAAQNVVTELVPGEHFMAPDAKVAQGRWQGHEFWQSHQAPEFAEKMGRDINRLMNEFPEEWLYLHPVKLSQWK